MTEFRLEVNSVYLKEFPHIFEFGCEKYSQIKFESLGSHKNPGIEICFILNGKFNWEVEQEFFSLYPNDASVTLPWEEHGGAEGFLDLGSLYWIIIKPDIFTTAGQLELGNWSNIIPEDIREIGKIFCSKKHPVMKNSKEIGDTFRSLAKEIFEKGPGYISRVNLLLSDLIILTARKVNDHQIKSTEDLSNLTIIQNSLMDNLDHDWTLEEMSNLVNKKITSFTHYMKFLTGYTPINYLVDLRIKHARDLLIHSRESVNSIAYLCGFSSPQYFCNTFKTKTGYTPLQYKLNHKKKSTTAR